MKNIKQDNREIKEKDIERIITILGTADGGCRCCVSSLIEQFVEEFSIDKTIASKIISKVSKKEDWYWADSLKSRFDWFKI